jgi:flagellar assembly protein FliH
MSHVIKATDRNRGIHGVAFNFDDMARQASGYLDKIRAEASQILVKATQDADAIRKRAEVDGRKAAEQAVEKRLDQKIAAQMQTLLPALKSAIEQVENSKQGWLTHWETQAVKLAAGMASRVIRRELAKSPDVPLALVREALQLAAGAGHLRVLMNPADHQALGGELQALVAEFSHLAPAELLADASIAPGGCRVETRYGTIDQQFDAQLARIEEELT